MIVRVSNILFDIELDGIIYQEVRGKKSSFLELPCTCLVNSPENLQSLETFTESAFHNIWSKTSINQNISTRKNGQIGMSTSFTNTGREGILACDSFWPDEISFLRKELKSK